MELVNEIIESINSSIVITILVLSMMVIIDYINVFTRGRMKKSFLGSRSKQYLISSFLGSTPGCLGAFMSVSMYIHGVITFGALTACMIATSGDEAFVMLTMFPKDAIILFIVLFCIGVVSGIIVDKLIKRFDVKVCEECDLQIYHEEKIEKVFSKKIEMSVQKIIILLILSALIVLNLLNMFGPPESNAVERIVFLTLSMFLVFAVVSSSKHYFNEHIVNHILRKHIWRIFLWTLGALLFVNVVISLFDLEGIIRSHMGIILITSALVGIIPESGPHMIFVTMYYKHLIPFSVLLTSSIVQDGHGMLPLLSYTVRDSILIKIINLIIGLSIGFILYFIVGL